MGKCRLAWALARRAWGGAGALCLAISLATAPAHPAPKISVETTRVEIGELIAGETAEVEFLLTNTGTESLKIQKVETSCGCVTSSYPKTLAPGEKGPLKVKLVSNPLWSGPVEKPITLRSNDPDQPAAKLQIVARMRPLLRFAPGNPLAIRFKKGETIRQVVTITSDASPPVALTGVAPGGPGTQIRLLPAESSDGPGVTRVELIVRPSESGGDFFNYVTLETSHPKVATIPIIVHGISEHPITVSPPILRLGALGVEPRADPAWLFTLLSLRGPFRVLEVETDTPALQVQRGDSTDGSYYEFTVRYLGGADVDRSTPGSAPGRGGRTHSAASGWPKGKRAGKLVVTTDHPLMPRLEVPYEAYREEAAASRR